MATPMQNPVAVKLHPITLAFSADPALEQSYREKMHHESFILSAGSLLVLSVAAVGQGMPAAAVAVLVVLLLRLWIQTMSNPQQAYMHNCCLTALCYMLASSMAVVCPQDRDEPAYTEMGVLLSLCSLHARQTAMPGEVRLAIEALVVGSSFMGRPWSWALVLERSSSSQPSTRLLVSAVLLVSELFGHTLEAGQRLTHAETRRRLAEAELRATTMEEEAQRLRRDLTSALDDESGASLPVRHIERLVGADALAEGLKLKDLCLLRRVGSGGFAAVYLATHRDRETVALKRPHSSCTGDQLVRFVREVTCLKQLSHPNIVRFIGVVWEPSLVLALEWMKGGSVHDVLTAKRSTLAPHSIALQVARGMAYLHSVGLCHRDLKTANVLLDDASPPTAKVADFGLSRYIAGDGPLSPRLSRVGTPLWVAPEVADRSLAGVRAFYTLSCDVYSFAILVKQLAWRSGLKAVALTGAQQHTAPSALHRRSHNPAPPSHFRALLLRPSLLPPPPPPPPPPQRYTAATAPCVTIAHIPNAAARARGLRSCPSIDGLLSAHLPVDGFGLAATLDRASRREPPLAGAGLLGADCRRTALVCRGRLSAHRGPRDRSPCRRGRPLVAHRFFAQRFRR